ncbi:FAD-dependent monooxygenase [Fulvivirga maritima]|uniref:NAD(P)/FAD-dependent oxidoreductase n=1 Tax=Fulvivirga maritima TaxID=2904247 RepID=UPI001F44F394|nr:FAD-dependent monooxygenase [Fulvivirga maritima]UII28096.1 FAD-dependent monooxygenase [Fulvivirga maritima]
MRQIIIIGGGLSGLICSMDLQNSGFQTLVIEKKNYPFHRVCGEYISNEVRPFLSTLGIHPEELGAATFNHFQLSSITGKELRLPLDLGGFGISRFSLDQYFYEKAQAAGVTFITGKKVQNVQYLQDHFEVELQGGAIEKGQFVIGAYGKRSKLDQVMKRPFFSKRSPYMGVKYHIKYPDQPADLISLHNFKDGYCGINKVEGNAYNLCYLTARSNLKTTISEMEENTLYANPFLREIFTSAEFVFEKPLVINEISFETKEPVTNHMLMCGDAAGMITPLCGNGMAMAIHSAKILSEVIIKYALEKDAQLILEKAYTKAWNQLFKNRLWKGRQIQKLFGHTWASELSVDLANKVPAIGNFIMKQTHGDVF